MNTSPVDTLPRYSIDSLSGFSTRLLEHAGVDTDKAVTMTARMIDGDLLGHRTHGLAFLGTYLERLAGGHISGSGQIEVIHDEPGAAAWRAHRLPGAWAMEQATSLALERIRTQAVFTITIANCSHIGCLQSYLLPFTEQGLLVLLMATNPGVASVAAPGGTRGVITTNPIAMGIPTRGNPILIDQSTSVGSNALFESYAARGERLPGPWVLDADGEPTDDASVLNGTPAGTIQPLGQTDFGYKGFGFGLMCEALALALPGYGRRSQPNRFGQGVFLQVIDPKRFSGSDDFLDEVDYLVSAVHSDPGAPGKKTRLPGERALATRASQLQHGVSLHPEVLSRLEPWSERANVPLPRPLQED
ncbi:lactate dehydrogenase [Zafaria cholistanensis]|uniref:Lactate dehydrogenase n=1 Tax=Zafaria cholistanensis TaxID=1682741 RepID=A0A5A7NTY3_9MICC|nr:Ldh family oxidoreductase [Zafaria cholistanensis]GER23297.1 lactate dehydrogenase [Zafaria cholistanensis]